MNILIQLYNFISLATTSWICENIIEFKIWKIFFKFPARKPSSVLGRAFSKYIYRLKLLPKIFFFSPFQRGLEYICEWISCRQSCSFSFFTFLLKVSAFFSLSRFGLDSWRHRWSWKMSGLSLLCQDSLENLSFGFFRRVFFQFPHRKRKFEIT